MILTNSISINREMSFSIAVVDEWTHESLLDVSKIIDLPTNLFFEYDSSEYLIYKHKSQNTMHLIASSDKCYGKRLLISYEVAGRLETFVHDISFEDILLKVGSLINDTYMTSIERIITKSKPTK